MSIFRTIFLLCLPTGFFFSCASVNQSPQAVTNSSAANVESFQAEYSEAEVADISEALAAFLGSTKLEILNVTPVANSETRSAVVCWLDSVDNSELGERSDETGTLVLDFESGSWQVRQ